MNSFDVHDTIWLSISDVLRYHERCTCQGSGFCSPRPCGAGAYICEHCGKRFVKKEDCLIHERSCADWKLVGLPCNEESFKLIGCRPRCEEACYRNEHCDNAFVIWRNKRTGEFAWDKP